MKRLALAAASLLLVAVPSFAADLDGPVYRERHSYVTPPPVIVEHDQCAWPAKPPSRRVAVAEYASASRPAGAST